MSSPSFSLLNMIFGALCVAEFLAEKSGQPRGSQTFVVPLYSHHALSQFFTGNFNSMILTIRREKGRGRKHVGQI
jgi:hypothetical protein